MTRNEAKKARKQMGLKQTAHGQYQDAQKDAKARLTAIRNALAAHKKVEANDPKNWGFAGDLSYVNGKLDEILDFLQS